MSAFPSALLALADGTIFHGKGIGAVGSTVGEVVFNTSMSGYQEILTDPSYCRQIVTLTYPHIGNTGVNAEDVESDRVHAAGLVIRDLPILPSNFRMSQRLDAYLKAENVVAIAGLDTRKLTRVLREKGAEPVAFQVTRHAATERPFTGKYEAHWADGSYHCICCGAKLFDSVTKFDAGCGWPSFDRAIEGTVTYTEDNSHGMKRVEITCSQCGSHLGHVFPDGPTETGQRYCVNSLSLDFEPDTDA